MCSRNCCLALGLYQYHRPTAYKVGVSVARLCFVPLPATLMIVSHKPVSSTFVCLCFIFSQNPWCRSLLSIGGDNLQFYPNFALFSTLGGMNLDHDFVQVWKFSVDQKKMQLEHFFPQIQVKTKKKRSSSKIEHFFPKLR